MNDHLYQLIGGWQRATGDSHPFGLDNGQLVELAESAVRSLGLAPQQWAAGDKIPASTGVVWDDRGVIWNRTDRSGNWAAEVDEGLLTDLVGTVYATSPQTRAETAASQTETGTGQEQEPEEDSNPVPCPECRWIRQDGHDHDSLFGGWTRCAHCGHEWRGQETRTWWCRAKHPKWDMYCDNHHHPLTRDHHSSSVYGIRWVGAPERQNPDRYHTLPTCGPDSDGQDTEDPAPDPDLAGATTPDREVYRNLIPILGTVGTFLDRMEKRYREGNPRMTAELCRTAEGHRDALRDLVGVFQDLLDRTALSRTGT